MNKASCQIIPIDAKEQVTVGDLLQLSCDGEFGAPIKSNVQFIFNEEDKYKIHVLNLIESNENHFKLTVTSYKPGEYANVSLNLSDGLTSVVTNELSWQVASILDPQAKPQPVPSQGPFLLSFPIWLWLLLSLVVVALVSAVFYLYNKRQKRRRLKEELLQFKTMLPAFSQYSKDIRLLQKQLPAAKSPEDMREILKRIEKDFRLYLIREFVVPALQVSDRELMHEIKKQHRSVYDAHKPLLLKIFSELDKIRSDKSPINMSDAEELLHLTRQTAEKLFNHLHVSKKT